jgi:hypothetical protein
VFAFVLGLNGVLEPEPFWVLMVLVRVLLEGGLNPDGLDQVELEKNGKDRKDS